MEYDVEDTVIRPPRRLDAQPELDDADTRLVAAPLRGADAVRATPPAAQPEPVAPLHYRFKVNSHEPIDLDRPAHVGRRPGLSRVPQRVRPRLVRVPSPLQEVSGTHLELRQEGASVVITDLRSTNGTIVTLPGGRARTLRPGESLVVTPGAIIDIGDDNRIEILPLQRISREGMTTGGTPQ